MHMLLSALLYSALATSTSASACAARLRLRLRHDNQNQRAHVQYSHSHSYSYSTLRIHCESESESEQENGGLRRGEQQSVRSRAEQSSSELFPEPQFAAPVPAPRAGDQTSGRCARHLLACARPRTRPRTRTRNA